MRELKFRAWNSYQNKMYEWNEICEMDSKGNLTLTNLLNGFIDHIKPLQYTGLKDKNGKGIYDGDIIDDNSTIFKVVWETASFGIERINGAYQYPYFPSNCDRMEIIGNIHENPELL